ncbi:WD40 repeat domain-containing protein [Planktothrix sp. FACHB-1365]|uniref:WD40 repeat domain-containing protein n=1 Tax=Planktothrix sp. FACHB-1365 TaxID=2692855 RepID=UPI001683AAD0|nr:hypothetical protein [Planktothrix sp. FACHB-1365]MBD2481388.1 hypothetical protein [Planktothrix sp. FACHB-1365]
MLATFPTDNVIFGVDCSDNGEYIATGGNDNSVKIWQPDGTFLKTLSKHNGVVRDIAFRSDGLMAASASDDGSVKLWQRNQSLLRPLYGHQDTVWDIATSADGQLIASGGDNWVRDYLRTNIKVEKIDRSLCQ